MLKLNTFRRKINIPTYPVFHYVRSLRLHFDDIKCDYNVQAADINIFVETRLCHSDNNAIYEIDNFKLFRNDFCPQSNVRTAYGTAVYIKNSIKCKSEPYRCNFNDVEISVCIIHQPFPNLHIIGIYRSKAKVNLQSFITAINHVLDTVICDCNTPTVILGDFNVDLMDQCSSQCKTLINCLINQRGYTQLLNQYTTDYRTQIDHIYTNIPNDVQSVGVLESYYSDHKPVYVCFAWHSFTKNMKQKIKVLRFVLCSPFNPCSPFIKGTYTSNYKAGKTKKLWT